MDLRRLRRLLLLWLLFGAAALALLLSNPSEAENAFLLGYSRLRLLFSALVIIFLLILFWALRTLTRKYERAQIFLSKFEHWLLAGDRLYHLVLSLAVFFLLSLGGLLLSWLVFPAAARPLWALAAAILLSLLIYLLVAYRRAIRQIEPPGWLRPAAQWRRLAPARKTTLLILAAVGLVYFALFVPVNLLNTESEHAFYNRSGDEGVIYPILMSMFAPGDTFYARLYHLFIYEDYHYGYPFYVVSALTVLPVRLIAGADFAAQVRINLILLRQMVSVLPVILSALVLVYLITRFEHRFYSIALFVFLLAVPGAVKYNVLFWHPDGLAILFVVLTLFFLERDRFRFGRHWIFAAVACGIASAIRLLGFFCVLAVAYVLLYAWLARKAPFRRVLVAGLVFLLVMGAVILVASPFLLMPSARARFGEILAEKQQEMKFGYGDPDPENIYRTGWDAWLPFLELHYGHRALLALTALGLLFTSLRGENRQTHRLIGLWVIPSLGYLVYFVAVKSFQYLLPPMLIFLAAAFNLPIWLRDQRRERPRLYRTLEAACLLLLFIQFAAWLRQDWGIYWAEFPR